MDALQTVLKRMEDALSQGRVAAAIGEFERIEHRLAFADGESRARIADKIRDVHRKAVAARDR